MKVSKWFKTFPRQTRKNNENATFCDVVGSWKVCDAEDCQQNLFTFLSYNFSSTSLKVDEFARKKLSWKQTINDDDEMQSKLFWDEFRQKNLSESFWKRQNSGCCWKKFREALLPERQEINREVKYSDAKLMIATSKYCAGSKTQTHGRYFWTLAAVILRLWVVSCVSEYSLVISRLHVIKRTPFNPFTLRITRLTNISTSFSTRERRND